MGSLMADRRLSSHPTPLAEEQEVVCTWKPLLRGGGGSLGVTCFPNTHRVSCPAYISHQVLKFC